MNLSDVIARYPALQQLYRNQGGTAPNSFLTMLHRVISDYHGPARAGRRYGTGSGNRKTYTHDEIRAVAVRLLVVEAFGRGSMSELDDLMRAQWADGVVMLYLPKSRTLCSLTPTPALYHEITHLNVGGEEHRS